MNHLITLQNDRLVQHLQPLDDLEHICKIIAPTGLENHLISTIIDSVK